MLPEGEALVQVIGVTKEKFCNFYPKGKELLQTVGDRVTFLGKLSHDETIRYVSNCDCNIFIREKNLRNQAGFPTKFVEAFTCGVRIITTDVSDIPIYADDRVTILQDPSVTAVATAMSKAVREKKQEKELRSTFHYESYETCCREWLETI
jgi:glycosyltransferase involved in cell wall biosynthesis